MIEIGRSMAPSKDPLFSDPEDVIKRLCPLFAQQADALIDLRDAAIKRIRPGLCVECYFRLQISADSGSGHLLFSLRSWLESNIEVIARDPESRIIEKLPLQLDATDLATYCHRVMGDFREDRAHLYSRLTLEFQYKEAA
jgi:hypothetical protein